MEKNLKFIRDIASGIEGWLTDKEGKLLYMTAKNCKGKGVIVEIGSWKGKSTIMIAGGSQSGSSVKVYAVDPHTGSPEHKTMYGNKTWTFKEFKENIRVAGVDHLVVPIVKTSEDAAKHWDKPMEFLFIDGDHEYESVKKDFLLWFPHLVEGGFIMIHDTTACVRARLLGWPGPKKIAKEFIFKSKNFKNIGLVDTITYATKCRNTSFKDRIKAKYVVFLKLFPDFIHSLFWRLPERVRFIVFYTSIPSLLDQFFNHIEGFFKSKKK